MRKDAAEALVEAWAARWIVSMGRHPRADLIARIADALEDRERETAMTERAACADVSEREADREIKAPEFGEGYQSACRTIAALIRARRTATPAGDPAEGV